MRPGTRGPRPTKKKMNQGKAERLVTLHTCQGDGSTISPWGQEGNLSLAPNHEENEGGGKEKGSEGEDEDYLGGQSLRILRARRGKKDQAPAFCRKKESLGEKKKSNDRKVRKIAPKEAEPKATEGRVSPRARKVSNAEGVNVPL